MGASLLCSYCGYTGDDKAEHEALHRQLAELMEIVMPPERFYALWAAMAIKLGWACDGPCESDEENWRGWAATRGYSRIVL